MQAPNWLGRVVSWFRQLSDRNWTTSLTDVREGELEAIDKRRNGFQDTEPPKTESANKATPPPATSATEPAKAEAKEAKRARLFAIQATGLCLSGGGIRSAAICLGALQGLDATKAAGWAKSIPATEPQPAVPKQRTAFTYIDYLSSVSGGGYMGAATTARMRGTGNNFPFRSDLGHEEPEDLRRIRDRSNYLFPPREWAYLTNLSIYLRGLFANFLIVAPWLLLFAALTLLLKPDLSAPGRLDMIPRFLLSCVGITWQGTSFGYARLFAVFVVVYFLLWALLRSWRSSESQSEVRWWMTELGRWALLSTAAVFFVELQPWVVRLLIDTKMQTNVASWGTGVLALISGFIAYFKDTLQKLAEKLIEQSTFWRFLSKAVFWLLCLPVPLLLWVAFLNLCVFGYTSSGVAWWDRISPALVTIANPIQRSFGQPSIDAANLSSATRVAFVFALVGVIAGALASRLSANANSLHRLYRERLNRTFFSSNGSDYVPKLAELHSDRGPYHLINAAVNLQGSRFANERGRNADFFMFSPKYVGSKATGYVSMEAFEKDSAYAGVDLGAAVAISGAAASPNMGSSTMKWLAPTIAFLNVRLGYWIKNPRSYAPAAGKQPEVGWVKRFVNWVLIKTGNYFLIEAFGLLNEEAAEVYLSDGGHIDNLGFYELLRRRCRLIIVVDAERDSDFLFPSFVQAQRYARIDYGIRVSLPWRPICAGSKAVSEALAGPGSVKRKAGPHCAVGWIHYTADKKDDGILLYVKASLSGDESDYIIDYARRNPAFPHEATVDQLFSEEQFEVYRALGFHALHSALSGEDCIAVVAEEKPSKCDEVVEGWSLQRMWGKDDVQIVKALQQALGLVRPAASKPMRKSKGSRSPRPRIDPSGF